MIFNINGKTYKSRKIGYGFMVWAEQKGVVMENMDNYSTLAVFLAYFGNMSIDAASEEIEAHIINSDSDSMLESVKGLTDAIAEEQNNSAFFRKIFQTQGEDNPENQTKESAKTE